MVSTTETIETEIRKLAKIFNYTTRSIPLEELQISGEVECSYDISEQSRIVERALLGFPPKPLIIIPRSNLESDDFPILDSQGRWEMFNDKNGYCIIDGYHEASALESYIFKGFKLTNLKIMTFLNDTSFNSLDIGRQRRFYRSTINVMYLDWKGDMSVLKYFQS